MRLSVVRGGGIAGIAHRTVLSTDSLSAQNAQTLEAKVAESAVLTLPDDVPREARHPEDLLYELTIENEGQVRTVRLSESRLPEAVRSLIAWVTSMPEAEDTIEPPGPSAPKE